MGHFSLWDNPLQAVKGLADYVPSQKLGECTHLVCQGLFCREASVTLTCDFDLMHSLALPFTAVLSVWKGLNNKKA